MTDGSRQPIQHRFRICMVMTVSMAMCMFMVMVCVFDHRPVGLHVSVRMGRMNMIIMDVMVGKISLHSCLRLLCVTFENPITVSISESKDYHTKRNALPQPPAGENMRLEKQKIKLNPCLS